MVIHDMRNPTMSIQYGVKEALKILSENKMKMLEIKRLFDQYKKVRRERSESQSNL